MPGPLAEMTARVMNTVPVIQRKRLWSVLACV
ncbi:MAG: hypothetical protein RLZZ598_941, partial [Pseudomonadota bacterium]